MSGALDIARRLTLWPDAAHLNEKVGCWGEIGRVVHWIGAAFASNVLVVGVAASFLDPGIHVSATMLLAVIVATIIYLPARGLRRLMAGE
jgi:hypothetical protein